MTEPEFREFMRELTLRHERAMREMVRRTDEMIRRSDVQTEALVALREESRAQIEALVDLREESRAQRRALFAVLDRLDPGGQPPATA